MKKLLVIDVSSVFHRAFHSYSRLGFTSADGRPVSATYGFFTLLAGIADKVHPDAILAAFDSRENFRKQSYPEYKASRKRQDDDFYIQLNDVYKILEELKIGICKPSGWEADDVLASAAAQGPQCGFEVVLATSDRDSFAHISDTTQVLRLASGLDNAEFYTPAVLEAKYGITPDQYLEYAALRGDASDNLNGVDGIGEKTAMGLLKHYGTVEKALLDAKATVAKVLDKDFETLEQEISTKISEFVELSRDRVTAVSNTELEVFYAPIEKALKSKQAVDLKKVMSPKKWTNLLIQRDRYMRNIEIMEGKKDIDINFPATHLTTSAEVVHSVIRKHHMPSISSRVAIALGANSSSPPDTDDAPF